LWAIVPLPFLYIVLPPFWLTAAAVGLVVTLRPSLTVRLSPAVQNLLGIVILIVVVASGGVRVGPLRPLGQLLLLLASVRTLLVVDRRSFVRVLPALFLAWLVSLTASTHIAALLYFAVSAALWWWVGMELHLLGLGEQLGRPTPPSVRVVHAATAAAVALMLAVPIFVVMPRLRSPWIAGRGGVQSVTGFSSRVELSGVGTIRQSQEEALIVRAPGGQDIREQWTRLRATAFERVTVDAWAPRRADRVAPIDDGVVWLHERRRGLADTVELEIELRKPTEFLFVPIGAVALSSAEPLHIDPAGGVALARELDEPLTYTAWVVPDRIPRFRDPPVTSGPTFEPPEQVRRLAEQITSGLDGPAERAAAIERHLQSHYEYSLQGMARIGPDPVAWFLLESRRGHCEYFAGGMVVLLDALGIPARMVGGYSGGTVSAGGSEVVIREANAHAWVEAWIDREYGWQPYDPTPAAGVPGLGRSGPRMRIRHAWEWLQAGWDRYVLTYGLGEQLRLLAVIGE
jgi:transglutaminase-like putative cysteine protease